MPLHSVRYHYTMQQQQQQQERSFVDDFLSNEARNGTMTRNGTRLELARAKNRRDKAHDNLLKAKEKARLAIQRMREQEEVHKASEQDVQRLKQLLREETDRMDLL
jgi:hypothetical protein